MGEERAIWSKQKDLVMLSRSEDGHHGVKPIRSALPVPLQTVFVALVGPELHSYVGEFVVTIPEVFIV